MMALTAHTLNTQICKTVHIQYLLHLPAHYDASSDKKWPVLLFLHGAGERGNDLEKVKVHGPPKLAEHADLPFIIIAPQCPEHSHWQVEMDAVIALLDEVTAAYRADPDRIYVTGLSMGGFGTWSLGIAYPERFAALVPICGGHNPQQVSLLKQVPVWVFHGAKDTVVPLSQSEAMVEALREAGGDVKLTVYPEAGHDSWTEAYNSDGLYEWLLQHSLRSRPDR
ncbi:prolyl oligopeptidase family serine peptidase [Paenibacillus thiaminolyticus]|uniref:carboxylesterase family protein n=1 Tax=Paenibacillus thiaminolyticus TaxID=49283 RepID=UPI003D26CE5F